MSEYTLTKDIQDYAAADPVEKKFLTEVMRLFTQNDVSAGTGYDTMLRIFKPTEVKAWLANANAREYTHI